MIAAVESYLAVRRAAGFTLSNTEYLLRSFASFATDRNQTHIRTATAIDWASLAKSLAQRHTRYQTVCRFAQYLRVEDSRHESPPANHFGYRKSRRVPHIYSRDEIDSLVLAAMRLPPSDSLHPKTYATLLSLLAATGMRISEALHLLVSDITPNGLLIRRTKFSEKPIGTVARHCSDGLSSLSDAASRKTTWWRPSLRFGRWATARVLESSQHVPDPAEIGGAQTIGRSMATHP